ncbi:hypothetical protein BC833DRAFT_623456 [Globomyces pollinis-pini]|nr:hypothetical protein BC833DRAFT_623456 [Globomyces pollinis-pini]
MIQNQPKAVYQRQMQSRVSGTNWKNQAPQKTWKGGDRPTQDMNVDEMIMASQLFLQNRQKRLKSLIELDSQKYQLELKQQGLNFYVERL